jgi:hypothetical protein
MAYMCHGFGTCRNAFIDVYPINTATVRYQVTNQSRKTHTLAMKAIPGVTQITTSGNCPTPFVLGYQQSCILYLSINGSDLTNNIMRGPVVCTQDNPNQCYQPTPSISLHVIKEPTVPLTPMFEQNYALCAGAVTFNFDGITYAKCRKKYGNSLGLTHSYSGGNIQTVSDIGNSVGSYMVSTYSPPDSKIYALYSCDQQGAYAQCNGGLCFTNTTSSNFPGFESVGINEIICSCPIVYTKNYHVTGPATCPSTQDEYDAICSTGSQHDTTADGVSLHIGAGGNPEVTIAMNLYYDKVFGTHSSSKVCKRPLI